MFLFTCIRMFDKHYLNQIVDQLRHYKFKTYNESRSKNTLKISTKQRNSINNNKHKNDDDTNPQNRKYSKEEESDKEHKSIIEGVPDEILFHLIRVGSISLDDYKNLMITNKHFCRLLDSPLAKKIIITECQNMFNRLNTPENILKYLDRTKKECITDNDHILKYSILYFKKNDLYGILLLYEIWPTDKERDAIMSIEIFDYFLTSFHNANDSLKFAITTEDKPYNFSNHKEFVRRIATNVDNLDSVTNKCFSISNKFREFSEYLDYLIDMGYVFGTSLSQDTDNFDFPIHSETVEYIYLFKVNTLIPLQCPIVVYNTEHTWFKIVIDGTTLINDTALNHPVFIKLRNSINKE